MTGLVLGTAQLGLSYGVTNAAGRPDDAAVREILVAADRAGIDRFDTSPDYGDAQERLAIGAVAEAPRYITKFGLDHLARAGVRPWSDSARALGVARLDGVLFHRTADLRDPRAAEAWQALGAAQAAGEVGRRGASIYDAGDLSAAVDAFPGLDLLQVPGSIVDRRLLDSPLLAELHAHGVEIHVRSAFLQGLLLLDPARLPPAHSGLAPTLDGLRAAARELGATVAELALAFLRAHPVVDAVVVGVTSAAELRAVAEAWTADVPEAAAVPVGRLPDEALDPRGWPEVAP